MEIKKGSKVALEYEGRFDSGEVFDSTKHGDHDHPLEFEVGVGQVIPGFEEGVLGLKEGDEKEIKINSREGYGEYREELKKDIPRSSMNLETEPKEGMMLMLGTPDGKQFPVKILKVDDEKIVIDLNHPLAGKDLTFKVKIVKVDNSNIK